MGVMETALKALEYLSPLYGERRFTLENLSDDGVDELVNRMETELGSHKNKKQSPKCIDSFIAGAYVGKEILDKYNGDTFDPCGELAVIGLLVTLTGEAYAGHAYHAQACGCNTLAPGTADLSRTLNKLVNVLDVASNVQGDLKEQAKLMGVNYAFDAGPMLGYILFKHHKVTKLGNLARMSLEEAAHLLKGTIKEELRVN